MYSEIIDRIIKMPLTDWKTPLKNITGSTSSTIISHKTFDLQLTQFTSRSTKPEVTHDVVHTVKFGIDEITSYDTRLRQYFYDVSNHDAYLQKAAMEKQLTDKFFKTIGENSGE